MTVIGTETGQQVTKNNTPIGIALENALHSRNHFSLMLGEFIFGFSLLGSKELLQ